MKHKMDNHSDLICTLDRKKKISSIGNKAANLQRLAQMQMRVPVTHVLKWEAYQRYIQNDLTIVDQVQAELKKLNPEKRYAVRSSANIEDSFENSFAGQFKTVLDVQGADALLQAVWAVWGTAQTREIEEYLQKRSIDAASLRMAVILQEMVSPVYSGVVFSRNPVNGLREIVVEAVAGQGTALVQEGATPLRWIYRSGRFKSQPEGCDLPDALIAEVIDGCRRISTLVKRDVDLEWVYDGAQLYWVQMREITSLRTVQVYSNSISREMLAGIIKPLIWSVNIPLICSIWVKLITDITGPNRLSPENLVRSFYYRAYFNMGLLGEAFEDMGFPAESLEMMWGIEDGGSSSSHMRMMPSGGMKMSMTNFPKMLRMAPRMAGFAWNLWGLPSRLPKRLAELETAFRSIDLDAVGRLSPQEILASIDRLYQLAQEAAYYNIIVPLTMYFYNSILRKQLEKVGTDITRLEMGRSGEEFHRYDPNHHLMNLRVLFRQLSPELQEEVSTRSYYMVVEDLRLGEFRSAMLRFMGDFGHLCDNGNDFSTVPWRENADTILKLVTDFQDPVDSAKVKPADKIRFEEIRLPLFKRFILRGLYERARAFSLYREQISYIYTLGYGLFRVYFMALGRHLAQQGVLEAPDDVFYIEYPELRRLAAGDGNAADVRGRVAAHKAEIERTRHLPLPAIIYGTQPPVVEAASARQLTGTPTSRGYCTAPVKVVTGIQDFPKVKTGDILIIPYSDVGWTPLFARAAGVIAESGGMLSHSSIVAREYGIPAIVSVLGATSLSDGTLVSMDAYKGVIYIQDPVEIGEETLANSECQ